MGLKPIFDSKFEYIRFPCADQYFISNFLNISFQIVMTLLTNENTKKLWEHEFEFTYSVKLTVNQLLLKASVDNKGDKDFELTFCFHTYFRVPKIADASVHGILFY